MPAYSEADLPVAVLDRILEWLAEAPQPRDGRGLNTRYCANCHGADGRGGPTRSSIVGEDLDEFIETVRDGEGGRNYGARRDYMPSWSRMELSDDAIRAIYNHLRGR
jgi:mono/diheme cytochrome c family protein